MVRSFDSFLGVSEGKELPSGATNRPATLQLLAFYFAYSLSHGRVSHAVALPWLEKRLTVIIIRAIAGFPDDMTSLALFHMARVMTFPRPSRN
jgi:hypothetical protein